MMCPLPAKKLVKMPCSDKSTQLYGNEQKISSSECSKGIFLWMFHTETLQNISNNIHQKALTLV